MSTRPGSPLVYTEARAREDGRRLLGPNVVLENEIIRWITRGLIRGERSPVFTVTSPCGRFEAVMTRRPGRFRPKPRAWWVLAVRANPKRRRRDAPDTSSR